MKSTKILNLFLIYILFLSSLIIGLFFNEDFAGGARIDYELHKIAVESFIKTLIFIFKLWQIKNTHSPFFIIFLLFLIEHNQLFGRIFYLFLSSLIPIVFYFILKIKYKISSLLLFIISNFLLLSPYYRSTSIWPGDETISLVFLCLSIFYYFKYQNTSKVNPSFKYLILNIFFLSICCYFRPIYCLFAIFFAYEFLKLNNTKVKFLYITTNLILSLPAIYYIFI